jgi:hypothetical protein
MSHSKLSSGARRGLTLLVANFLVLLSLSTHAINWNYLDGPFGAQPSALTLDADGNTWAGLNGAGVYMRPSGATQWIYKPGLPTMSNHRVGVDSSGTAYASGSGGLYSFAPGDTAWRQLDSSNGFPGSAASGLFIDADDTVYAAASSDATIYKRAGGATAWVATGTGLPGTANDIVKDGAGNFWAAVNGKGVYRLAPGSTTWAAVNGGLGAEPKLLALVVVGNDLFAGIQFGGVVKLANAAGGGSAWTPWVGGALSAGDAVYALAKTADGKIFAAGLGKVYRTTATSTAWVTVGTGIASLGPSYAIVWSDDDALLTLANGSGVFTLAEGETAWDAASDGMTASTIYGLAMTAGGDLYAATFGQGVQRQAAGTSVWAAVDPANLDPVATAIVVDQQGTVYAVAGGTVKRLANGAWQTAGNNLSGYAYALVADGANALYAGLGGSVQKLAPGAGSWTTVGNGLPSSDSVRTLAIDGSGTLYAGIYGNGIWSLPTGGSTWTQMNAGLPDTNVQVLTRDAGGAMHAGVGGGVYRFASGSWQKVGAGAIESVYALAFDAHGDLYAGTDNGYAWRLPAGTTTWVQVRAGLDSRSVDALLAAGGRVYAGTDASRGSRSGVYALWTGDTVVEFYNTILDNFFITANAAEQAAIQGGSAGPGWIVTGNAFSAGGPSLVCRFYGSITPGPNSHFYTIDPAECQELKDLQASTPATLKRWNFESNDFASAKTVGGGCPAGTLPVYRAYNDGFSRGIDSNHRITASQADYLLQVAHGWQAEGVVMCAPR